MLALILFSFFSQAENLSTISLEQFPVGAQWSWAYSEQDQKTGHWKKPYLFERYTVTKANGPKITIEMSSAAKFPVNSPAHHKFVVNIDECLAANVDPNNRRRWYIAFYTKSMGPNWELVSQSHKPYAFTEKFNCVAIARDGETFRSEYFQEPGPLQGVARAKDFEKGYKFEFLAPSI